MLHCVGVRRLVPIVVALVGVGAAGCASEDDAPSPPQQAGPGLARFALPEAYLPPPTPEAAGSSASSSSSGSTDGAAAEGTTAEAGAPTDDQVAADLKEAFGSNESVDHASVGRDGLATAPAAAPAKLVALIQGANQVARKPYVYGGGHGGGPEGVFSDSAYDCSGSVSYALAAAGYITSPMASGPLETWGKPGRGKWVTIYANAGHAWMVVAGLRFDTSGREERDTRWQTATRSTAGFVVRHPPGL